MQKEYVIIGGGVAGLAAACHLAEQGKKPLIIEGGHFPSHKVCGEFFSPESVTWLKKWGITFDQTIDRILFDGGHFSLELPLIEPAGCMSHLSFDQKLLDRAEAFGASMMKEVKVSGIKSDNDGLVVQLNNGESLSCSKLLIAAGRLPFLQQSQYPPSQFGRKAYFSGLRLKAPLTMFSFPGTYVGISAVKSDVYNVAFLTRHHEIPSLDSLKQANPQMRAVFADAKMLFPWMEASIPQFGFKNNPKLGGAFFIGDASTTIPPASGAGLSMALSSGIMAADYAMHSDAETFKGVWMKEHKKQLRFARLLHYMLQNPALFKTLSRFVPIFPSLPTKLFGLTREKSLQKRSVVA